MRTDGQYGLSIRQNFRLVQAEFAEDNWNMAKTGVLSLKGGEMEKMSVTIIFEVFVKAAFLPVV